jgi:hypothetical protein
LFNEVYQSFIIYVGCGFHLARIHPSINQSGAKYFLKGFMFSGNENLLNLRRMKAKNCVFWAGIWRVLTWDWSFPIKTTGSFL